MRTKQGSIRQSLRSVQSFLETNTDQLADVNKTGARQDLDAYIVALSGHAATQTGSQLAAMGLTQKQYALREALLRDHMAVIVRIAKAKLPPTPEVAPIRMPRGRLTVERLSAAAYGMAKAAEPFAAVFIGAGLPSDFVAQLTAAADALVASMSDRTQSQGSRRGATSGLQATLIAGRKIVHVLDAMVTSALQGNPALLSNWNSVKRVRITPTRPNTPATPTPQSRSGDRTRNLRRLNATPRLEVGAERLGRSPRPALLDHRGAKPLPSRAADQPAAGDHDRAPHRAREPERGDRPGTLHPHPPP